MAKPNPTFESLKSPYIFPIIEKKLAQFQDRKILNLGVGDVGLPLAKTVGEAIKSAVDEMMERPIGYGPCEGYGFLRDVICENEYRQFGIGAEEIFISSGTNPDASAIHEVFRDDSVVAMTDPTYPVYRDACLIAGKRIVYLPTHEEGGFIPKPPAEPVDLVYLCTPSNPAGVAMNREQLTEWVKWAKDAKAVLLIDNVYNAFVESEDVPESIYEIPGAKGVAIEMRSFSKSAGFTGLRCSYVVVPKELAVYEFFVKRVDITTNGIAYPVQRGAEAVFTREAKEELGKQIDQYKRAGAILRRALDELSQTYYGGVDAPYIFWKAPDGLTSWEFFDELLSRSSLITIPGSGFGPCGEGYVRLSCFISEELAKETADALHHHYLPA